MAFAQPRDGPDQRRAIAADLRGDASELAAYALYVSPHFKHHKSRFKGDAQSLKQGMKDSFAQFPGKLLEVKRALEDGEHVAVHLRVRLSPDGRGISRIHLFRFEDGRIAEPWEAAEMAPETPVNENGLFRPAHGQQPQIERAGGNSLTKPGKSGRA